MKYIFVYIALIFFLLKSDVLPQQSLADSLEQELLGSEGKAKVDILNRLADVYQYINTQSAIKYAELGIDLADSIDYTEGIAGCYGSLGFAYINLDRKKALEYTNKALEVRTLIDDKAGIATSLNVLGVIYYYAGEYLVSIDYHTRAIALREEVGNIVRTATSYNNIALVHIALGNYETALDYLFEALKVRIDTDNKRGIGIIRTNIGNIYSHTKEYDKAFEYYFDALEINKSIGTQKSEANSYFSIASLNNTLGKYDEAISYYNEASSIYYRLDEKNGIANSENGIAESHKNKNQILKAIEHAEIALSNAKEINSLENIVKSTKILQECYRDLADFQKAYKFLSEYQSARDSLKSDAKLKKLAKIELDYKLQKISREQENKLNRQNLFIQFLIVAIIFAVIIVALILRGLKSNRQSNYKLSDLNMRLQEVNNTKDKFFSILGHDLRGPYQTLLGLTEFMADNLDTLDKEEIRESLNSMSSSLHKQFNLLNELLQWSELQSGRFELDPESISLFECIEDVIDTLRLTAVQKRIKINNDVNQETKVYADNKMLKLVIRNLISNSIKFTPRDGNIKIFSSSNSKFTEISVSDDGIGMNNEELSNLFRIDVHKTQTGTANERGSGLGLILCKDIITKHGGDISVISSKGKGSTFTFSLPHEK